MPVVGKASEEEEEEVLPSQFPCYDPFDPPFDPPASPSRDSPSSSQISPLPACDFGKPMLVPIVKPRFVVKRETPGISLETSRPRVAAPVAPGPNLKPVTVIKPSPLNVAPCVPIDLTVDDTVPTLDLSQSSIDMSQCDQLLALVEDRDPNFMLVDWPRPVYVEDYNQLSEGEWIGTQLLDFYLYHVHQNLPAPSQNDIHLFTTEFYLSLSRDKQRHLHVRGANLFDKEHQLISYLIFYLNLINKELFLF